jgi:hypothetical protein
LDNNSITPHSIEASINSATGGSITRVSYRGWPESYLLSNGIAEALVVPAIGRVMQFRLAGNPVGTFWENQALDGRLDCQPSDEWLNFGGDKCWPAPQSAWPQQQGRAWPPPFAFDGLPMQATVTGGALVLSSPIDSAWGIQAVRHIELGPRQAVLRIRTEYRKLHGPPAEVAIWSITQMQEPERICMLLNPESKLPGGYVRLLEEEPAELEIEGGLLFLARHRRAYTKIGADGASLAWIGTNCVIRIDVQPMPGDYPDGGCLTEIYTNPDPLNYVELETLGPLVSLRAGDRAEHIATYTITPRLTSDPRTEAHNAFRTKGTRIPSPIQKD